MTPSAHSPLLTTSMHSGLAVDSPSTPTPAASSGSHPASVFRRPPGRPVTTVSRAMEATRGQIKTISTAAKHSVLSNHRSPVSPLSVPSTVKSSPTDRSKQPLASGKPSPAVKSKPTNVQQSPSKAHDPSSSSAEGTLEIVEEKGSSLQEAGTTPLAPDVAPAKTYDPPGAVSAVAPTPKATSRKAVEGVEVRSETRHAIVSLINRCKHILDLLTPACTIVSTGQDLGCIRRGYEV